MSRDDFLYWLRGCIASWTVRFGLVLAIAPDLVALVEPEVRPLVGEGAWTWISVAAKLIGAIVIALRLKTDQSIPARGGKDVPDA